MRGGNGRLIPAALLAALLWPTHAWAHRLDAEAHARPFGLVQVESWYETGQLPHAARVEVFAADGRRLAEGTMENGAWTTAVPGTAALRVVVNAGGGHRAEATVSADERGRCAAVTHEFQTWLACATPQPSPFVAAALLVPVELAAPPPPPVAFPEQRGGVQWGKLSLGVALLLGVAVAFEFRRRSRNAGPASNADRSRDLFLKDFPAERPSLESGEKSEHVRRLLPDITREPPTPSPTDAEPPSEA